MKPLQDRLNAVLRNCNRLLDEEERALESRNLDTLETVEAEKKEVVNELVELLNNPGTSPLEEPSLQARVQAVLERIRANSSILAKWMEHQEKEIAQVSKSKLNLRGVKKKYVTEHQGYLRRNKTFKA